MKRTQSLYTAIIILVIMTVSMGFPMRVKAAFSISDFSPKSVVNNVDNAITIEGMDFITGVQVAVGETSVIVTYYSPAKLIVRIPANFPAGEYSISLLNPGNPVPLTFSSALIVTVPTPTPAPTPTSTPNPYSRPQIVVGTYSLTVNAIRYGQDFDLNMYLDNAGGSDAYGILVTFTSSDLLMLNTGGVVNVGNLGDGEAGFVQTMTLAKVLVGVNRVSVEMNVSYYDEKGTAYSDKFMLNFPAVLVYSSGTASTATPKPAELHRPQLVVMGTSTNIDPLQPGAEFTLSMSVQNVGNMAAKGVTMIIGGGSGSSSGGGTPQAGVSAGNGDFTNFAPVGSSNIQSLGDLEPGVMLTADQKLVVNVSTSPGVYPMKVTFSYLDDQGNPVNDEQVITLLVYNLPNVDVSFYQPVGILTAGQTSLLPFQVVSLGKRNFVLGKMTVESNGGSIENGEGLVGSLDPGGYFTLDSMFTPFGSGPVDLTITIEYKDDFNQSRSITQTITLDVSDMMIEPTPDPNMPDGSGEIPVTTESFWQKVWRFILGLFGLDSGVSSNTPVIEEPTLIPIIPASPGGKG